MRTERFTEDFKVEATGPGQGVDKGHRMTDVAARRCQGTDSGQH